MISSPGLITVSWSGFSPGRRWNSVSGTARSPSGPMRCTVASSAASGTAMSEGLVATHSGECPRIARSRWVPSRAGQPEPGSRLLQGLETSWK
ncbi:hypothetical protein SBADM41S_05915 [Streptomyces badius]